MNAHQGPAHVHTATEPPRGIKRRRVEGEDTPGSFYASTSADVPSSNDLAPTGSQAEDDVEAVDLTEVNDDYALAKVLAKQREDAIKAQAATENREGRTTLTATKCAICMDTPTDATTTVCGMSLASFFKHQSRTKPVCRALVLPQMYR